MKKILKLITVLLLLVLLFQLTACGTDVPGDQAELPPDSQTEDPTPWPAPIVGQPEEPDPTENPDPTPDSTETELPTISLEELEIEEAARERLIETAAYEFAPEGLLPFVFGYARGHQPRALRDMDTSWMKEDGLYVYNEKTHELTATGVFDVTNVDVTSTGFLMTKDHLYVVICDGTQILRVDYAGNEQTVLYETDRTITNFDYCGVDANGVLAIVLDRQQVVLFDIATGETEVIMEQPVIWGVDYYDVSAGFRIPEVGATLYWQGETPTSAYEEKLFEIETGYPVIVDHVYYIELDEMKTYMRN